MLPVHSPLGLVEVAATPAAPPAGSVLLYSKAGDALAYMTPSGAEVAIGRNVVVGTVAPTFTTPGVWFQTDSSGNVLEIWTGVS
jgi:hypothetical protein